MQVRHSRDGVPLQVISTADEMRRFRREITGTVALVATLGGMHAGHEAHLKKAKEIADVTVGSLFLNPTQFSPSEDLANYPNDRQRDLAIYEKHGAVAVFAPPVEEMYPPGDSFRVDPGRIATIMEGARRPDHFVGVATVVAKLFAITRPDAATFGEKDAQQLRIIEKLNRELRFGIDIVRIPTVREHDGLALSSRNQYLTLEQRAVAPVLYQSLQHGRGLWLSGERSADSIRQAVQDRLTGQPLVDLDYVSVADSNSLEEHSGPIEDSALLSLAARIGSARLIDNILLTA